MASQDRHPRRRNAGPASDQTAQGTIRTPVHGWSRDAREQNPVANTHEFILPGAGLEADPDLRVAHGTHDGPNRAPGASVGRRAGLVVHCPLARRGAGILAHVSAFVTAGAGFLLAVLWFDLMFDVQVRGHHGRELPEDVLASIAGYYRRVTTAARPMNRLIAAVMLSTLAAIVDQIARGNGSRWVGWASIALAGAPILLAGLRTVPSAVRLGGRADTVDRQSGLARSIFREHALCFLAIAAVIMIQLTSL
jgi:hypothetical protein